MSSFGRIKLQRITKKIENEEIKMTAREKQHQSLDDDKDGLKRAADDDFNNKVPKSGETSFTANSFFGKWRIFAKHFVCENEERIQSYKIHHQKQKQQKNMTTVVNQKDNETSASSSSAVIAGIGHNNDGNESLSTDFIHYSSRRRGVINLSVKETETEKEEKLLKLFLENRAMNRKKLKQR
jgi:hypothetical protein